MVVIKAEPGAVPLAAQRGADWVNLDCDGDTVDELETYDWQEG